RAASESPPLRSGGGPGWGPFLFGLASKGIPSSKLKEWGMTRLWSSVGALVAALSLVVSASAATVGPVVNATNSQFAANDDSLGMDPSGALLAYAVNDWHYNDGCGFGYSTDGGATWSPESFAPFT